MSIAWRNGAANAGNIFTPGTLTLTVPSEVASGDVVFIMVSDQPFTGTSYPTITVTSSATAPVQVGSDQHLSGTYTTQQLYWFLAGASDASATITVTPAISGHTGISLGAWSGAAASQPDVDTPGATPGGGSTWPAPSATTVANGDWAVYFAGIDGGAAITSQPAGTTLREQDGNSSTAIADSAASVGSAGTSIGGGNWTANAGGSDWGGWTVGMAPLVSPAPPVQVVAFMSSM